MIGKLISALAGRAVARSIGGVAAGPAGVVIGSILPAMLPRVMRRLGPVGMVGAAIVGTTFARWYERRRIQRAALHGMPTPDPAAQLGADPMPHRSPPPG